MEQANEAIQDDIQTEQPQAVETQEELTEASENGNEQQLGVESNESELKETEHEYVDIEYEGVNYNLPPELKDALLRQSDYSKKTQTVADDRRALEAQQQQFQQAAQMQSRNMQGHAQLAALQNQLEQYTNVDWDSYSEQDPTAAQKAFFQYTQLKDATTNLGQQLQSQESQALQQQQMTSARQLEQGKAELARDIKGWSPELVSKLNTHGETYGFSHNELTTISDPRAVRVLHDAYLYRQSLKKATTQPETQAKPISKVKGRSTGKPNPDKMSADEWQTWRNKQLASR